MRNRMPAGTARGSAKRTAFSQVDSPASRALTVSKLRLPKTCFGGNGISASEAAVPAAAPLIGVGGGSGVGGSGEGGGGAGLASLSGDADIRTADRRQARARSHEGTAAAPAIELGQLEHTERHHGLHTATGMAGYGKYQLPAPVVHAARGSSGSVTRGCACARCRQIARGEPGFLDSSKFSARPYYFGTYNNNRYSAVPR